GGIGDAGFEDADDGGSARAEGPEADDFAEHVRVAVEGGGPEMVGEDGGALGGGAIVALIEEAAEDGAEAHHFEIVAADDAGADFARLAQAVEGEADGGE